MKKKLLLIISIILFIVATIFVFIGIWKNNNTSKAVGVILCFIVNLIGAIRVLNRWNEEK